MKNMVCHAIKIVLKHNKSMAALMSTRKLIASYEPLYDDGDRLIHRNEDKKTIMGPSPALINCHNNIIPKGFVAVYVGSEERRFLIPTRFLSVPDFKIVMERAAEEFGYEQLGGLRIPCDEQDFEQLLETCLSACKLKTKSY